MKGITTNKLEYRGYTIHQEGPNVFYIETSTKTGCIRCVSFEKVMQCIDALEGPVTEDETNGG